MMSGGISEALVTTMLGLSVAVPIVFAHTLLSRRVETLIAQMEEKAVGLVNLIHKSEKRDMQRLTADTLDAVGGFISAGGVLMIPLLVVSVVMWVLIFQRIFFLRRLHRKNMSRTKAWACIQADRRPDARVYRGAVAMLVNEFMTRRCHRLPLDKFILDETVVVLVSSLDRHLALIGVLAAIAPLMGLLGTVLGMITTFDVISFFGTGNAKAMAGGISEALITTQTGLLVAIPGLYMKNFLSRRVENLKQRLASVGLYLRRQL